MHFLPVTHKLGFLCYLALYTSSIKRTTNSQANSSRLVGCSHEPISNKVTTPNKPERVYTLNSLLPHSLMFYPDKETVRPRLIRILNDISANASFTCTSSHEVTWYKFGTDIAISKKRILKIENVTKENHGYYTCKSKTERGYTFYSNGRLIVFSKSGGYIIIFHKLTYKCMVAY